MLTNLPFQNLHLFLKKDIHKQSYWVNLWKVLKIIFKLRLFKGISQIKKAISKFVLLTAENYFPFKYFFCDIVILWYKIIFILYYALPKSNFKFIRILLPKLVFKSIILMICLAFCFAELIQLRFLLYSHWGVSVWKNASGWSIACGLSVHYRGCMYTNWYLLIKDRTYVVLIYSFIRNFWVQSC